MEQQDKSFGQKVIDHMDNTERWLETVSPSFCLAKWNMVTIHLSTGLTHSCHHPTSHPIPVEALRHNPSALHNSDIKLVERAAMLNGEKPPACEYCWKIEKFGGRSDRVIKSSMPDLWFDKERVQNSGLGETIAPAYVELNTGYTCNFSCLYCSNEYSSKWMEEIVAKGPVKNGRTDLSVEHLKQQKRFPIKVEDYNPYVEAFWRWWPDLKKTLKVLRMTGGEPLLNKMTWELLDKLIEEPIPGLTVSINTNMGVPNKLIVKLVEKMNAIALAGMRPTVFTSAEATGAEQEYVRTGMDWKLFKQNITYFLRHSRLGDTHFHRIVFMSTVNALSAGSLPSFIRWVLHLRYMYPEGLSRIGFSLNQLRWPLNMDTTILPLPIKEKLRDELEVIKRDHDDLLVPADKETMDRVYEWSMGPAKANLSDLISYLNEMDERRGTHWQTAFPWLADYEHVS